MNQSNQLNLASAINIFGTSFTWTGLPALLFLQTGSAIFSSLLFVSASFARIIAALFGGYLIDQISSKKITILSLLINILSISLLYICVLVEAYTVSFLFMIVIQFFGSVYSMSKNIWYRSLVSKDGLVQAIAKMNSYEMSSKTVGFTIGPLIFTLLEVESLILNMLFTLVALILILNIPFEQIRQKVTSLSKWQAFQEASLFIKMHPTLKSFSIVTVLNGIIAPTLLSMATVILIGRYSISPTELSYFWLISGGGVIIANIILAKYNVTNFGYLYYKILVILSLIGGLVLVAIAPSYLVFLIGYVLMTFSTPLMMNIIKAEIFKEAQQQLRGKVMSLIQASADLGTLVMIMISWLIIEYGYINYFLWLLVSLGILQVYIFLKQYKQMVHNSNRKEEVVCQIKK